MKRSLLLAGVLAVGLANAQTGKVGINTETPNETLEVNGTVRVDNLPVYNEGKIYDGAETLETTFTGADMMVADEKGNLGKAFFPFAKVLYGAVSGDAVPNTRSVIPAVEKVESNASRYSYPTLKTITIEVDKRSLVVFDMKLTFNASSSTRNTKQIGGYLTLSGKTKDGKTVSASNLNANYLPVVRQSGPNTDAYIASLSNEELKEIVGTGSPAVSVAGAYSIAGSEYRILEPGTYTVTMRGVHLVAAFDMGESVVTFGAAGADKLDIIAFPLEL